MSQSTHLREDRSRSLLLPAVASALLLVGAFLPSACTATEARAPEEQADAAPPTAPGPAALWARNCARCHGYQPPSRYSDSEWRIVMHHMRLQCYLTGEEQRAIEQFLRAAND